MRIVLALVLLVTLANASGTPTLFFLSYAVSLAFSELTCFNSFPAHCAEKRFLQKVVACQALYYPLQRLSGPSFTQRLLCFHVFPFQVSFILYYVLVLVLVMEEK